MSEFTPADACQVHHKEMVGDNSEAGLLDVRLKEDEQFAVSFVNECLAGSYDEEGTARWWQRARSALGGKTPQEMWAEDRVRVIALARSIAGPMDQS